MDLQAVKTVATPDLVKCAIGAAVNAQGLLDDAELLATAGRHARAYALAALAVEEAGKAGDLVVLAVMSPSLRAQAPVARMLEWHQLKLVGGLLISALPLGTVAEQLPAMPLSQVAGILEDAQVLAQDVIVPHRHSPTEATRPGAGKSGKGAQLMSVANSRSISVRL